MVDQAIARALESLQNRDQSLAKQVIEEDEAINTLRFKIEEACLALIATQQPAAHDLRAVIAAMSIVIDMERMADHAAGIFVEQDAESARSIASKDDEMDILYRAIFDELVEIMAHKPDSVERATYLLWCAHNLERIGDRVTNIAERVVFVSTGDMRELNV
jgi:phosphate transport system protein